MTLRKIQDNFAQALFSGTPDAVFVEDRISAADRFDVYRNNVIKGLADIIIGIYPLTAKLAGDEFMRGAARRYALQNPPRESDLALYGGGFADTLPATDYPFLPDMARLEWAYHEAEHAADVETSARLLQSPYDLLAIRKFCVTEIAPAQIEKQTYLLILRPELEVLITEIEKSEFDTLSAGFRQQV